ncbi:MAG TPA: dihydrolipoamide acetyltransferase family protein [Aestuariivirga sp.]|nr:dihydrolipoamide acetyltransferase family protein [Aestuariivirga sp.]
MPVEVILPKVDMDMATGKIAKWHVKEGDAVKKGGLLFEIETDKAAMEIDAPSDGIIRSITAVEGAVVPVGTTVALIYQDGESASAPVSSKSLPPVKPITPASRPDADQTAMLPAAVASGHFPATPLARRLAKKGGITLENIAGSGPRGRIAAIDVQGALARPTAPQHAEPGGFDVIPLDGMRRTIAQRLTLSKQTVPHFYLTVNCDLTRLSEIREILNAQAPRDTQKLPVWTSINDFIIKAMASALKQVPDANVTWAEEGIHRHHSCDVGVAVAVEGGLFTPVVRAAETKTLSQISKEMKDLATRARARKLLPTEYQGGTTTISNLGMYGIEQFTAIINPPQATILAVGAGMERFVPVNGLPVLRTQMTCTLSCDHRAVDGALGAQLLAAFRTFIEEPALMLA